MLRNKKSEEPRPYRRGFFQLVFRNLRLLPFFIPALTDGAFKWIFRKLALASLCPA